MISRFGFDVDILPSPIGLEDMALVGWWTFVESKWHPVAQDRSISIETEEGWLASKQTLADMEVIEQWMGNARRYLPEWFDPDLLTNIQADVNQNFIAISTLLNDAIAERREKHETQLPLSQRRETPLYYRQVAFEECRKLAYRLWERVAYRGKR